MILHTVFPKFADFYRPQRKLQEGNVFHRCLSVHRGWGWVSLVPCPFWGWVGISRTRFLPGEWICLGYPSFPRHETSGWVCSNGCIPTPTPGNGIQQDMFGKRAVSILLECLLNLFARLF